MLRRPLTSDKLDQRPTAGGLLRTSFLDPASQGTWNSRSVPNLHFHDRLWFSIAVGSAMGNIKHLPLIFQTLVNGHTWSYVPPDPTPPTQYLRALNSLSESLATDAEPHPTEGVSATGAKQTWKPKYQHMVQTLTDLTWYLTTQTYILPTGGPSGLGFTTSSTLATSQQKEIRLGP